MNSRMNLVLYLFMLDRFHEFIIYMLFLKYQILACKQDNYPLYIGLSDRMDWSLTYDDLFMDGSPLVDLSEWYIPDANICFN